MSHDGHNAQNDTVTLGATGKRVSQIAGVAAAAGLLVSLGGLVIGEHGAQSFFSAYLVNYAFVWTIALGALFFVLLQHVCAAGWSVTTRRIAEIYAATLPVLAVAFVPIIIGMLLHKLHPWTDPAYHDEIVAAKTPYLNIPFFLVRWVIYFAAWIFISRWFLKQSRTQDETRDGRITLRMQRLSYPMMIVFALTAAFASFDLLMSMDPHWFSTIYPVYVFSGAVVGSLALIIITAAFLQGRGVLGGSITVEHYHDLGKLLFAFVFFWGYIAFSQYMLIWYGAIPEETGWFWRRGATTVPEGVNAYSYVTLLLLFGHFLIPFAGLLSRHVKRRKVALAGWSIWLLLMHWVDLFWLVRPDVMDHATHATLSFGAADVISLGGGLVGMTGLLIWAASRVAGDRSLLAAGDPRLPESLAFHQTV